MAAIRRGILHETVCLCLRRLVVKITEVKSNHFNAIRVKPNRRDGIQKAEKSGANPLPRETMHIPRDNLQ